MVLRCYKTRHKMYASTLPLCKSSTIKLQSLATLLDILNMGIFILFLLLSIFYLLFFIIYLINYFFIILFISC